MSDNTLIFNYKLVLGDIAMSEYNYENFVKCFIERTKANSEIINKHAEKDEKSYEITQLINSLFGLLIVPLEKYKDIKDSDLKKKKGFNKLHSLINNIKKIKTTYKCDRDNKGQLRVYNFIKHFRNALAHLGQDRVLFIGEGGELVGLIVCDEHTPTEEKFCVELDFETLDKLIEGIVEMYSDFKPDFNVSYHEKVEEKRKIFEEQ